ncbi:hypothetical protein KKC1_25290 [Calderihabitans maritimus]|uniref:Uncharacterized protein n=1 Tax=Calderihabitans maritimus TaxID=1246530 RepID=A0A1Z5HVQ0_9FIRM|nr:hypothetical protein KKC1_25290 [Calderihabitans maritimus]
MIRNGTAYSQELREPVGGVNRSWNAGNYTWELPVESGNGRFGLVVASRLGTGNPVIKQEVGRERGTGQVGWYRERTSRP